MIDQRMGKKDLQEKGLCLANREAQSLYQDLFQKKRRVKKESQMVMISEINLFTIKTMI